MLLRGLETVASLFLTVLQAFGPLLLGVLQAIAAFVDEIFSVIHDGVSADMDGYGARLSDTDIWNVVNYVRSVAAAR